MQLARKAALVAHLVRWLLTWRRFDPDGVPAGAGSRFISARQAAALIPDDATVISCGMAGHHRASVFYWAIRDRFKASAHPRNLTWCAVSAIGGRGRIPGTVEELGLPGLLGTAIFGHHETAKSLLRLASQGLLELHTMPQGEFAFLVEGQARGEFVHDTEVGKGTFLDPQVGAGSAVTRNARRQFIRVTDTGRLRYQLPRLEFGLFSAPYADAEGNIYVRHAVSLTEIHDIAHAVRANGGTVLATVAGIIDKEPDAIYLPAHMVDGIVVSPYNEQTGTVRQLACWPMLCPGEAVDEARALEDIRFLNRLLKITPTRSPADNALARLAASVMLPLLRRGALVNIGVGLPEEASRLLYEAGISKDLLQTTEIGAVGGIPTNGIFFGAAINPQRLERSSWVFHRYEQGLDLACLGMLEVDSAGNVNVSRRGEDPVDYVGPGGFTNIAHCARTIVFVGSFAAHARLRVQDGKVKVLQPGQTKFVEQVREVTFNGAMALRRGQDVWYVTHLGVWRLTAQGLLLVQAMPGVDIARDIVAASRARMVLPANGAAGVPLVDAAIVTGDGFALRWPDD